MEFLEMSESITQVWEKLGTMRGKPFSEEERDKFLDVVLLYIERNWSWDVLKDLIFGMLELIEGFPKKRDNLKPMQPASSIGRPHVRRCWQISSRLMLPRTQKSHHIERRFWGEHF